MYSDFYTTTTPGFTIGSNVDSTWLVVSAVIAIIGGIVGYIVFVSKKKDGYTGFVAWLHDFLNFKTYFINMVLKVLYMITAIYITLSSFSYIRASVAAFFLVLIFGNLLARIGYELMLMLITLVDNTTEINNKLSGKKVEEKVAPKTTKKKED